MNRNRFAIALFFTALLPFVQAKAEATSVPFDPSLWQVEPGAVVTGFGTSELHLRGQMFVRGVSIADGVVEVDALPTPNVAFVGVMFRVPDDDNGEVVYLRPFKSNQPDAVQYTPRSGRVVAWQLYSGSGFTAAAPLSRTEPIHLKVVFDGPTADVFVNGGTVPVLRVPRLQRGLDAGSVGLWGGGDARFANFSWTERPRTRHSAPAVAAVVGAVRCWSLSSNIAPESLTAFDPMHLPAVRWEGVAAGGDGLLDISRHRLQRFASPDFRKTKPDAVLVRARVRSSRAQTKQLAIAYSDAVRLYLNGEPLYSGDATLGSRDPGFLGVVGLGFDFLYPRLRAGDNELLAVVTENNWGWAIQLRFEDPSGLSLDCSAGEVTAR